MEPAPPPITIVNPNAPAGTTDLLDSGREPWHPTRRQQLLIVLTAVAVAAVAGLVADVRHVRHQHALDAAAIKDISLTIVPPSSLDTVTDDQLIVINGGRLPLRVTGIALVGDGYHDRRQDVLLTTGTTGELRLSTAKNCRPALFTEQAQRLRVRVRTARGDEVVRTLDLPEDVASMIGASERQRCGYLQPAEALTSELVRATRRGRDVVLTLSITNQGAVPLTLEHLLPVEGLHAATRLPITLPKQAFWTGHSRAVRLTLTLRVTDCQAYGQAAETEPGDGLHVSLRNPYVTGEGTLDLIDYSSFDGPQGLDASALLAKTCPARYFPQPVTVSAFQ